MPAPQKSTDELRQLIAEVAVGICLLGFMAVRRIIIHNGLSTVLLNRSPSRSSVDTSQSNASHQLANHPVSSQSPTTSSTQAQI